MDMGAAMNFLKAVTTGGNLISPNLLKRRLGISGAELEAALGLDRGCASSAAKAEDQDTQHRLRDMTEIINRVIPWAGSELAAYAWYRSQPLPPFGDQTAEDLVCEGRAEAVKTYLSRIAVGGYA